MIRYGYIKNKDIISVKIVDIIPSPYIIDNYITAGEKVAIIDGEDFIGIIPKDEIDLYKYTELEFYKNRILKACKLAEFKTEDNITLIIFSCKKALELLMEKDLKDLSEGYCRGKVIGFTDYSMIVKYGHIKTEVLNRTLSESKCILPREVFNINDEILITLDRIKKSGSRILVKPEVTINDMLIPKEYKATDLQIGKHYIGIIDKSDVGSINVFLGVEKRGDFKQPIKVLCPHPIPVIDQYCSKGMFVTIRIIKADVFKLRGEIVEINLNDKFEFIENYKHMVILNQLEKK